MSKKHFFTICLLAIFFPNTSLAHSTIQGIGNFYNGLLHPLVVPAHLLLLIAFGLFLGLQEQKKVELALVVFTAATVVGLIMAWFSFGTAIETLVLASSAAIGLLVAIKPPMALFWCAVISLIAGLSLGIDSTQEELFGKDRLIALLGSGVAIFFLTLCSMAFAVYFNQKPWQKIGIRIIASWAAASSLLALAFALSAPS